MDFICGSVVNFFFTKYYFISLLKTWCVRRSLLLYAAQFHIVIYLIKDKNERSKKTTTHLKWNNFLIADSFDLLRLRQPIEFRFQVLFLLFRKITTCCHYAKKKQNILWWHEMHFSWKLIVYELYWHIWTAFFDIL